MPRARSASTPSSSSPRGTGELALIERIRQRAASASRSAGAVRLGIGDDCAILAPPRGYEIVVTTDMSLEGRHFRRDWHSARAVGHRALARGLSDLAAMGARPLAAFLSLALPQTVAADPRWLDDFLDGLLGLAALCKVPLAGGDTAESPSDHVLADIVLLGAAPVGKALRRSGAKLGDRLFLTGALGGAAAELASLAASNTRATNTRENDAPGKSRYARRVDTAEHPHLYPQPRLAVGQSLLRRGMATACIDVSDGLSTDLAHLCAASDVAAEIEVAKLPLHPLARALGAEAALHAALHGGEDYELLFTASADALVPRTIAGVAVTCIGKIVRAKRDHPAITLIEADGRRTPLEPQGWEHLR
jgi:thiamine-monophosphate kinase